jgi:hypothetical protein
MVEKRVSITVYKRNIWHLASSKFINQNKIGVVSKISEQNLVPSISMLSNNNHDFSVLV